LADQLVERHAAAAGGVVGGRVEAAGAAERAALEPHDEPHTGAVGAAARLERVDPDLAALRRGHLPGLGRIGSGRSPADEPPRSSSVSSRSGVTMLLSIPLDGTEPSSVPPSSRSRSWLSFAARKLYAVVSRDTPITSRQAWIGTPASRTPRTSSSLPFGYSRY